MTIDRKVIWPAAVLMAAIFTSFVAQASSLPQEKELLRANAIESMVEELGLRESDTPVREMPGWSKPEKVLVLSRGYWELEALQAVAPGVEIVMVESADEAVANVAGAQAIIGYCNEKLFTREPGLHWIQVYTAGVERCLANPGMHGAERVLTNGQRIASPALAEHSIALMMALVRGLDLYHQNQLKGEWRDIGLARGDYMELDGRTMLVVGLGGIGTQVARKAHGLGMRVIATRNSRREGPDYVEYVGLADEVNDLATQADVVVNTVPLTDQTLGMFDAAFFKAMKPTAYFISVGRGASTKTDDLVAALENGEIAGAGLDVTDPEPLPRGHVLWTAPRVIITPHNAGRSDRSWDRLFLLVQENLRRYVAGEPMYSVVDIERGY
ncbi:MAG: D-2-hydroxyacid dehydrogenase [Xanthomonadales bacterium]|jgi:phosphoglycerate dehydrogenase-like enzyme|nr:D-2-hydroxyacid dehydrogenase [Xanthomonadales bacterium]